MPAGLTRNGTLARSLARSCSLCVSLSLSLSLSLRLRLSIYQHTVPNGPARHGPCQSQELLKDLGLYNIYRYTDICPHAKQNTKKDVLKCTIL